MSDVISNFIKSYLNIIEQNFKKHEILYDFCYSIINCSFVYPQALQTHIQLTISSHCQVFNMDKLSVHLSVHIKTFLCLYIIFIFECINAVM